MPKTLLLADDSVTIQKVVGISFANEDIELIDKLRDARERMLGEIGKQIIGQKEIVDQMLVALFCGGHSLMVGVPGLAKTLMVRTIASILDLKFSRIQFTPDLMPSDITGSEIIEEDAATGHRRFKFIRARMPRLPSAIYRKAIPSRKMNASPSLRMRVMMQWRLNWHSRLPKPAFLISCA